MPKMGMRESMQATTATLRAGATGTSPGNRSSHASFASSMRSISDTLLLSVGSESRAVAPPPRAGCGGHRRTAVGGIGQDGPVRTVEEHQAVVAGLVSRLPAEDVPLAAAHGRVLAEDVAAQVALPGFDNSAMDGYAARWAEIRAAAEGRPVRLPVADDIPAGRTDVRPLAEGTV